MAIDIIQESPEHHFLTFLEKLKGNPSGWAGCTFSFSKKLDHGELVTNRAMIARKLDVLRAESTAFLEELKEKASDLSNATIYQFTDNDIILLTHIKSDNENNLLKKICDEMGKHISKDLSHSGYLTKEMYSYQKIADHKFTTARRMGAYQTLMDENRIKSISLRRKRREEPVILVVEDDRFTATYASNTLKDFDVVLARSGEEAMLSYIEHAPDIVFLDIHLPGMNGHQTLQGIKAADPDAFVVMLSVDAVMDNVEQSDHNGAASFLKKPFSQERLLNTVRLSPFVQDSKGLLPYNPETRVN